MKAPAFQFYPKQFLGDDCVMLMSTEAIGAHIILMCIAWQQDPPCSLPDDPEKLRKWTHLTLKKWSKIKNEIFPAWRKEGDRLYQDGLLKEHEKQEITRAKRRNAANRMWMQKHSTCTAHALQKLCSSSSSSTSTSLKETLSDESVKKTPPTKIHSHSSGEKEAHGKFVRLSAAEYESLCVQYGSERTDKAIRKMNTHIGSSGKEYASHYERLNPWIEEDLDREKNRDGVGKSISPRARFDDGEDFSPPYTGDIVDEEEQKECT